MNDETLDLMEERRKVKNDLVKYKEMNKKVQRSCRKAKEAWWEEKCAEIEELQEKHDSFNLHKKVKEVTGKRRKYHINTLRDANGGIILGIEKKIERWQEYVRELFHDHRIKPVIENLPIEEGPEITRDEVTYAIKNQKNNKAPNPDEIYAEILKIIAEREV